MSQSNLSTQNSIPNLGMDVEKSIKPAASCLLQLYSDQYALILKTFNFYYNVMGPRFSQIQCLLNTQLEKLECMTEATALQIRSVGFRVPTVSEILKFTKISTPTSDWVDEDNILTAVLKDHEHIVNFVTRDLERFCDTIKEFVIEDFLLDVVKCHRIMAWTVRSHLERLEGHTTARQLFSSSQPHERLGYFQQQQRGGWDQGGYGQQGGYGWGPQQQGGWNQQQGGYGWGPQQGQYGPQQGQYGQQQGWNPQQQGQWSQGQQGYDPYGGFGKQQQGQMGQQGVGQQGSQMGQQQDYGQSRGIGSQGQYSQPQGFGQQNISSQGQKLGSQGQYSQPSGINRPDRDYGTSSPHFSEQRIGTEGRGVGSERGYESRGVGQSMIDQQYQKNK